MKSSRYSFLFAFLLVAAGVLFFGFPAEANTINVTPSSGTVATGGQIQFVATVTCTPGPCTTPVGFGVSGLPADASQGFSTASCIPTCSTVVTITTGITTGVFLLTVNTSEGNSSSYTLTIVDPSQPAVVSGIWTQTDTTNSQSGFNWVGFLSADTQVTNSGGGAVALAPRRRETLGDGRNAINTTPWPLLKDLGNGADGSVTFSANTNLTTDDTSASIDANGANPDGFTASLTVDVTAGSGVLAVSTTSGFVAGDEVMIIQSQHSFNAGKYEFRRISNVNSATQLTLATATLNAYYGATGKARVIRVPNYTSVTINSGVTVTASAYNAVLDASGIIVFKATGTVTINGIVDANALGYAGGATNGSQGQSYLGSGGISHLANGGGGGGGRGSSIYDSGGGGGYGTIGGNAGISGGGEAYGNTMLSTFFVGSGGGGANSARAGGAGGGAVFITANILTVNASTGSITANGAAGAGPASGPSYGAGGGGSGGTIYLGMNNTATLNTTRVTATGGQGGNNGGSVYYENGGNGGTGRIYVEGTPSGTTNPTYVSGNGAQVGGWPTGVINVFGQINADSSPGATTLSIASGDTASFSVGDEILIIQMQHSSNAGVYEFRTISSKTSTSITFLGGLSNSYYGSTGKAQIVQVPNYTNFIVNGGTGLTAPAYNSSTGKGGIVIFKATGAVVLEGFIQVSGLGYGIGQGYGWSGQSYLGGGSNSQAANGGGGGGGRGGGIYTSGGGGGYGITGGSSGSTAGGLLYGNTTLSSFLPGSGGGNANNVNTGGAGGGAVFITANTLTINANSGSITANGIAGGGPASGPSYGAGGGGSGGGIYLGSNTASLGINRITALGGAGGSRGGSVYFPDGGAGGSGRIYVEGVVAGSSNPSFTPGGYYSTGSYTSATYDAQGAADFANLAWTTSIPSATLNIVIDMRGGNPASDTCNTDGSNVNFGPWQLGITSITNTNQSGSVPIPIALDGYRCAQYRATLNGNTTQTPSLNSITISFSAPSTFNFSTSLSPSLGSVSQGGTLTPNPTFTANLTYGATAPAAVVFSAPGSLLPRGVTVALTNPSPASPCTPTPSQPCAAQLIIRTSQSSCMPSATQFCPTLLGTTTPGEYVFPIRASITAGSDTVVRESTFWLTVTEPFNYILDWETPCTTGTTCAATNIRQGGSITASFDAQKTAGTVSETVNYTWNASPAQGISVSVPGNCFPDPLCDNVSVIVSTAFSGGSSDVTTGAKTVTITGTSGSGVVRTLTLTFSVTAGHQFSLQFTNNNQDTLTGGTYTPGTASPSPTLRATYTGGDGTPFSVSFTVTPQNGYIATSPATLATCNFTTVGQTCDRPFDVSVLSGSGFQTGEIYSVRIAGTSSASSFSRDAYYYIQIYGPFDFVMRYGANPGTIPTPNPQDTGSGLIYQGGDLYQTITLTSISSPTPEQITFNATNEQSGVTVFVNGIAADGTSVACTTTSSFCSLSLRFAATQSAALETRLITITAVSSPSNVSHTITYDLTVAPEPVSYNMRGWAWAENIGWISFNSQNCDTNFDQIMSSADRTNPVSPNDPASTQCPPDGTPILNYGAHLDLATYELSGYAWSETIGWITFEKSIAGTPPFAPYNNASQSYIARLNTTTGRLEGWGRAVSCPGTLCDQDSEWGWIKLSGGSAAAGNEYDVGSAGNEFLGWAWGGDVIGWISAHSANCDINGDGTMNRALGDSSAPAQCPADETPIWPYRVWVAGTLPNAPPVALGPQSTFLNRCDLLSPHSQNFTFRYRDNEGDPLAQFTITIYDAATNAVVEALAPVTFSAPYTYDPAPRQEIVVTYPYSGSALQYGRTYYFTVEVRDPDHLN